MLIISRATTSNFWGYWPLAIGHWLFQVAHAEKKFCVGVFLRCCLGTHLRCFVGMGYALCGGAVCDCSMGSRKSKIILNS